MAVVGGNMPPAGAGQYCGTQYDCNVPEILKSDGTYDFSFNDRTIANMRNAGVYPSIDLAEMPIVLSANPIKYCRGFGIISSPLNPDKVAAWKNYLTAFIRHYKAIYGSEVTTKWNFAGFNEADYGDPTVNDCLSPTNTNMECCSFTGTEEQYVRDILLPILEVMKSEGLLSNFHLGAHNILKLARTGAQTYTPENSNNALSSDQYLSYLFSKLTINSYQTGNFRSFAINQYGIYPVPSNEPIGDISSSGSVFKIKRRLQAAQDLLRAKGFDMPLRTDELGLMYNYNSNTSLHYTEFAGSWFASILKAYLDVGNIDQVNTWWYNLVKNGRSFNPTQWQKTYAYYTFLMFHQLANNQRLSVIGGRYDEPTLYDINAVAGKDNGGIIKALVYNHQDSLNTTVSESNIDNAIVDTSTKNVNVNYTHLIPGDYQLVVYQVNTSNISLNSASLPIVYSQKVTVDSSGTYTYLLVVPHHSVFLITMQKSFDPTITTEPGVNEVYINWTTSLPTTSYIAYSDIPTGFDAPEPVNWGKWRYNVDNIYAGDLETNHRVKIGGLASNKTYYFRIAGKDIIGFGIFHLQTDVKLFTTGSVLSTLSFTTKLKGISILGITKSFDLTFHSASGDKVFTATGTSGNEGVFSLSNLPLTGLTPGTYTVFIKDKTLGNSSSNHLRKRLGDVTLVNGANSAPLSWSTDSSYFLKPGDTTGDNRVTIEDISMILSAYTDLSIPVTSSNRQDDINGDNVITITDVSLALGTYTDLTIIGD